MRTLRWHTFTTARGDNDIVLDKIVSWRETLDSEKPGVSVIATLDGKFHIVNEDLPAIRAAMKGR
jgi:hypothetical protein